MQPDSGLLVLSATQAVSTSSEFSPQYVASWCHDTKPGLRGSLIKKLVGRAVVLHRG